MSWLRGGLRPGRRALLAPAAPGVAQGGGPAGAASQPAQAVAEPKGGRSTTSAADRGAVDRSPAGRQAAAPTLAPAMLEWPATTLRAWSPGVLADTLPLKVVVTGPFGAGKTTFVRRMAQGAVVDTDTPVIDEGAELKGVTTVTLDFAQLRLTDPGTENGRATVALFGTPGQARFEFMWRVLSHGMRVYVVLVDASRQHSRDEARQILRSFRLVAPQTPFVVAVNRWVEGHDLNGLALDLGLGRADVARLVRADVRDLTQGTELLQFALQFVSPRDEALAAHPVGG